MLRFVIAETKSDFFTQTPLQIVGLWRRLYGLPGRPRSKVRSITGDLKWARGGIKTTLKLLRWYQKNRLVLDSLIKSRETHAMLPCKARQIKVHSLHAARRLVAIERIEIAGHEMRLSRPLPITQHLS